MRRQQDLEKIIVTVAVHCCAHSLHLRLKILGESFHVFRMLLKELKK